MKFVQRKATTSVSKFVMIGFITRKREYLTDVCTAVAMEEIPGEPVLNWDQTGNRLVHPRLGLWIGEVNAV